MKEDALKRFAHETRFVLQMDSSVAAKYKELVGRSITGPSTVLVSDESFVVLCESLFFMNFYFS